MNPAIPISPRIVATIKLLARPKDKPKQRPKDLATVQRVNGEDIKNQKTKVDPEDPWQKLIEIRAGFGP